MAIVAKRTFMKIVRKESTQKILNIVEKKEATMMVSIVKLIKLMPHNT